MPIVSQAQRGAMYAAKAGKSTLGIPQSVGAEFVSSDVPGKLPKKIGRASKAEQRMGQGSSNGGGLDFGAMVSRANKY